MSKDTSTQWSKYQKRIRAVIEHIHNNPGSTLTSDVLADVAHLSPYHWHRIYKAITGESAAATVKRARMHKAAAALLRTDTPVAEVGASVGFADVHSFTRTFKAYYGIAPGQFRLTHDDEVSADVKKQGDEVTATGYGSVKTKKSPLRTLFGLWHQGDFMTIGVTFDKVMAMCSMANVLPAQPQAMGVYFADPDCVPESELRSFAGVVVENSIAVPDGLDTYVIPGGNYAVLTHKGPHALLGHGYQWLYSNWLPATNEAVRDEPCCEIYLNSPIDTAQQDLLTEICLPVG